MEHSREDCIERKKIEESLLVKYVGSSLGKQFRPFRGNVFPFSLNSRFARSSEIRRCVTGYAVPDFRKEGNSFIFKVSEARKECSDL